MDIASQWWFWFCIAVYVTLGFLIKIKSMKKRKAIVRIEKIKDEAEFVCADLERVISRIDRLHAEEKGKENG